MICGGREGLVYHQRKGLVWDATRHFPKKSSTSNCWIHCSTRMGEVHVLAAGFVGTSPGSWMRVGRWSDGVCETPTGQRLLERGWFVCEDSAYLFESSLGRCCRCL